MIFFYKNQEEIKVNKKSFIYLSKFEEYSVFNYTFNNKISVWVGYYFL